LRSSWASPGGPARSVAWARSQLAELGHVHVRTEQQRSWNLSATWRLESRDPAGHPASTWLKEVPPFFAHEAAVLRWLAEHVPGVAVPLIAADGQGRALLEHVEGEDAYGCGAAERDRFAALLHRIQTTSQGHVDALLARGLPDRRGAALMAYMRRALAAHVPDSSIVAGLLDDLPERFAALHACGIADSLVHGDFHPGNVRAGRDRAIVIDWGDSFIGHPALDLLRLTDGCTELEERTLIQSWSQRWRNGSPASEPERAVELLRPVTALRHAALFADICARIEPSERPYHVCDIPRCLQDAANSWRASPTL
jgi:aminoglycoside phosphotransferase (APT) family kinase protein